MAKTQKASYGGLTNSHNSQLCNQFQNEPKKYLEELVSMREELAKEFEKLTSPWVSKETGHQKILDADALADPSDTNSKAKDVISSGLLDPLQNAEQSEIDKIDMSYKPDEQISTSKEIDIADGEVKDRWSRYIGAMGIEAVAK